MKHGVPSLSSPLPEIFRTTGVFSPRKTPDWNSACHGEMHSNGSFDSNAVACSQLFAAHEHVFSGYVYYWSFGSWRCQGSLGRSHLKLCPRPSCILCELDFEVRSYVGFKGQHASCVGWILRLARGSYVSLPLVVSLCLLGAALLSRCQTLRSPIGVELGTYFLV